MGWKDRLSPSIKVEKNHQKSAGGMKRSSKDRFIMYRTFLFQERKQFRLFIYFPPPLCDIPLIYILLSGLIIVGHWPARGRNYLKNWPVSKYDKRLELLCVWNWCDDIFHPNLAEDELAYLLDRCSFYSWRYWLGCCRDPRRRNRVYLPDRFRCRWN